MIKRFTTDLTLTDPPTDAKNRNYNDAQWRRAVALPGTTPRAVISGRPLGVPAAGGIIVCGPDTTYTRIHATPQHPRGEDGVSLDQVHRGTGQGSSLIDCMVSFCGWEAFGI